MPVQQQSELLALAYRLTVLGMERTEQSSERSYLDAERTLPVVVNAAAALMILGFAIDHYQLYPDHASGPAVFHGHLIIGTLRSWSAATLIGLGVVITFAG